MLTTNFGGTYDWAYALALQPDGAIVVGGVSDRGGSRNLALARYLANGSLDAGFGQDGLVTEERRPLTTDIVRALAVQPDGRIVVAGVSFDDTASVDPHGELHRGPVFGADNLALARYTPEGLPDMSFGRQGQVTYDAGSLDEEIRSVALTPDGGGEGPT